VFLAKPALPTASHPMVADRRIINQRWNIVVSLDRSSAAVSPSKARAQLLPLVSDLSEYNPLAGLQEGYARSGWSGLRQDLEALHQIALVRAAYEVVAEAEGADARCLRR